MRLPTERGEILRLVIAAGLLSILVAAIVVLGITGRLEAMAAFMADIFQDRDRLREYVESWGAWAPAAFIAIQVLQVLFAPVPGEFTGAVGGFIFGGWPNLVYSTIGLTVGSVLAFGASRIIGYPLVKLIVSEKTFKRFDFLTERRGAALAFILFVFPGFPKDTLCYLLGLSPMGFPTFLFVCGVGRIPGTIMLSFSGSAVYDRNWIVLGAITLLCIVAFGVMYLYRDRVESMMRGSEEKNTEEHGPRK